MNNLQIFEAGMIGGPQIILIVVLLILLFGAKKIPELMKGMGKGIKEFKDATNEDDSSDNKKDSSK
ncbi:MAG: twin-arginine translocase TatA/TatE family subunit [Vicingaceae bacterium]